MSIKHYYIGVGGTGARVAESLVHLCAAGLGPDELFLMLIDPDAGNGNLTRTKDLIDKYQRMHEQIAGRADGIDLFRTKIVTPEPVVWTIFTEQNQTLGAFIGLDSLDAPLKHFAELLFSEADLNEKLNEGFRGRPAIGAVVMAQPNAEKPPWSRFWEEIGKINRADEAKVFVVGSIFGGTGAAGIPTLGAPRVLRDKAALGGDQKKSKIYLGSCLVLPYFTFDLDISPEDKARLFVKPEDFPLATSSALFYYLTKELAYDEMYLIGDSVGQVVGQFGAGSSVQKNRSHYVELGAALSTLDFYARGEATTDRSKQYFISARDTEEVGWGALPAARHTQIVGEVQKAVKFALTSAAMFFYALAAYGEETIKAMEGGAVPPLWWSEHFRLKKSDDKVRLDPLNSDQKEMIGKIKLFGERFFLPWLADINADRVVSLLTMRALIDEAGHVLPWRHAPLGQVLGDGSSKLNFDKFINDCLNHEAFVKLNAGTVAADRYFNLFALAANRFTQTHLNVQRPARKEVNNG